MAKYEDQQQKQIALMNNKLQLQSIMAMFQLKLFNDCNYVEHCKSNWNTKHSEPTRNTIWNESYIKLFKLDWEKPQKKPLTDGEFKFRHNFIHIEKTI